MMTKCLHPFVPATRPGWDDVCQQFNPDEDEVCGWPASDHTTATLTWVCPCCIQRLANDDTSGCEYTCGPDHAPQLLTAYGDDADLTIGMLWSEHVEGCPNRLLDNQSPTNRDEQVECECETITFSKSWCDGCGSPLGGERRAVTMWTVPS